MGRCRRFRRVRDYGLLHGLAKGMVQLLQLLLKVVLSPPVMPRPKPAGLCPHGGKPMALLAIRLKPTTSLLC